MSILEALWYGNLHPSERKFMEDSDYAMLFRRSSDLEAVFFRELTETGKTAYDEFWDHECAMRAIAEREAFIEGYRMGVRMILASISDRDSSFFSTIP